MAKSKKISAKRTSRATAVALSQPTMFVSGMVWLFTILSLIYLMIAYWKFGQ